MAKPASADEDWPRLNREQNNCEEEEEQRAGAVVAIRLPESAGLRVLSLTSSCTMDFLVFFMLLNTLVQRKPLHSWIVTIRLTSIPSPLFKLKKRSILATFQTTTNQFLRVQTFGKSTWKTFKKKGGKNLLLIAHVKVVILLDFQSQVFLSVFLFGKHKVEVKYFVSSPSPLAVCSKSAGTSVVCFACVNLLTLGLAFGDLKTHNKQ